MNSRKLVLRALALIALALCAGFTALAQTSTTGKVVGTVTDQTGAVVPGAQMELINAATNAVQTATSDSSGGYVFATVQPGQYKLMVKMRGFRPATVSNLTVEVNKSADVPMHLEVGQDTEVVEVTATAAAQLQTTDSQVGNVLSTDEILRLPTLQRNATELMNLQPATVTGGSGLAMRVAGGIDDQNTVTLDGLDITQSVVAGNTVVPTPADSVEEFRAGVSNPNANFDRASGANVTLIGRHGGNNFHGALYEYLQNSDLNANTEESNRAGLPRPTIHDNRFGGRIGGPIIKNKTFFFANYEGRRFESASQVTRTVPTDTLKQGILEFRNASGAIQQFNLQNAAVCGPAGNNPCDPRGLGVSPSVLDQWKLMPEPNYPGGAGDGLNTNGYLAIIPTPIQTDYGVIRLDHTFNEKMSFNGNYTYFRNITTGSGDISIINGNAQSVIQNPQRGQVIGTSLNYQLTPTMINTARFGYVRDRNAADAYSPTKAAAQLNIPG
ncbi:MAG TPA: carboxypeptidase-like regulatory domain-containing protein, partial [Bryobacteraceae bacterium]|nr:carboxypeptidase-like regulatory domain-containing protein [Bryobacteraceae bacterium]